MLKVKPSPISGFPEWLPAQKLLEAGFVRKITRIFESFGYAPIETAAVERDGVLASKGEINKQIYSIFRPNVDTAAERETGLSLHFDLTVPLARYVAQNHHSLSFPFKRYQIQKVWRGERSQKGRFREFYQCDIDIIGDSNLDLYADAEVAGIIYLVFQELQFGDFVIHLSNRKLLRGIMEVFDISGEGETLEFLQILDKVERSASGIEAIKKLIAERIGKSEKLQSLLDFLLAPDSSNREKLSLLKEAEFESDVYRQGVHEINQVYNRLSDMGCADNRINIDVSIVRGLDYYTGTVFETFLTGHEKKLGSICSGGRFDDLASNFIDRKLPGVGVSIGLTRLLSYIFDKKIITQGKSTPSHVMIAMMDHKNIPRYIQWMQQLRKDGINVEIYIQNAKLAKQLKYADKKGIEYVIIFGEDEEEMELLKLKNMAIKQEQTFPLTTAISAISDKIKEGITLRD
uniref:Histidine--tRNA ligase n=1 Tax=Candidatus Kentrum sp. MB TaxID=2138164 RepID=A0A450XAK2_9GAMM|nr:MAG: histidyl-tRNA synthetase [Candidatus Kentron sp. MB]